MNRPCCINNAFQHARVRVHRAYTLVEMLLTVAILAIAATMVIPSMGDSDTLRVQAAIRVIVADLTFAQSDALAFQQRRAIVFNEATNSYAIYEVNGATLDQTNDLLDSNFGVGGQYIRNLNDNVYAGATISDIDFDYGGTLVFGSAILIFDELGGPALEAVGAARNPDLVSVALERQVLKQGGEIRQVRIE